jgi:hypothetical protein
MLPANEKAALIPVRQSVLVARRRGRDLARPAHRLATLRRMGIVAEPCFTDDQGVPVPEEQTRVLRAALEPVVRELAQGRATHARRTLAAIDVINAVVLVRTAAAQFHLGLRRSNEAHEPVLHLAWHRDLRDQPLADVAQRKGRILPAAAIALSLDPAVNEVLQVLTRRVAIHYANGGSTIAYGFGEASATFERGTGRLTDSDAAFTCSTFVLAMLRSVGVHLIDASRWRAPTAEDVRWQREIGAALVAWIAQRVHGDLLHAEEERVTHDIGARRYRPTDVAAAALFGPETWPAGAEEIDPRARELEALL